MPKPLPPRHQCTGSFTPTHSFEEKHCRAGFAFDGEKVLKLHQMCHKSDKTAPSHTQIRRGGNSGKDTSDRGYFGHKRFRS